MVQTDPILWRRSSGSPRHCCWDTPPQSSSRRTGQLRRCITDRGWYGTNCYNCVILLVLLQFWGHSIHFAVSRVSSESSEQYKYGIELSTLAHLTIWPTSVLATSPSPFLSTIPSTLSSMASWSLDSPSWAAIVFIISPLLESATFSRHVSNVWWWWTQANCLIQWLVQYSEVVKVLPWPLEL